MLKELEHGKEWDYECYPALVAMIAPLGAVYVLVKAEPAKYCWFNVEESRVATGYFMWEGAIDHMWNLDAVIYMYSTMDDVARVCHWAEALHMEHDSL